METAELLLVLAGSARGDGGREVLSTLRTIVADLAPYDAGEVLLRHEGRLERWGLVPGGAPLAGEDLLQRTRSGALRLDDAPEAEELPQTRERLRALGFRSLLALPLPGPPGSEGALVLARRHGWAFVGASVPRLGPVAAATGLALRAALSLTALARQVESLQARLPRRQEALAQARREAEDGGKVQERLEALATRIRELESTAGAVTRERDALARELAEARSAEAGARAEAAEERTEREAAVRRVQEAEARAAAGEEELAAVRQRLRSAGEEIDRLRNELAVTAVRGSDTAEAALRTAPRRGSRRQGSPRRR